nr:putative RNA-directed DNA polymerase [Tanacetum cinerariifolium]
MRSEFEMTDLGMMRFFLGIEVLQTNEGIHISQRRYALELIKQFNLEGCNSVKSPMVPGNKLKLEDGEKADGTAYRQVVGSLMYITMTHPDIQFAISLISRFMCDPKTIHFDAAKKILRYLQGTSNYGIWYKRGGEGKMEVFTDSDFGGDADDYKSTSGYVVLWDGAIVAWQSKKQSIVTLSSTEAEYVAASMCACQVIWIKGVLDDLGVGGKKCTTIWCDNNSTIKLSKHTVFHGRCKHIGV